MNFGQSVERYFDTILIDAPCSGSGVWRRNPEAKWRLSADRLQSYTVTQLNLLKAGAGALKVGGRLVYITCSILNEENRGLVDQFLALRGGEFELISPLNDWKRVTKQSLPVPVKDLQLTPRQHHTDGFYIAILAKKL